MGFPPIRHKHAFIDQFDNHFGMHRAGSADFAQAQANLFFENRYAHVWQHFSVGHFQAPGVDRGSKDLNCSAIPL